MTKFGCGLLASLALCASSQAAVVFTDDFSGARYPGLGTIAELEANGWSAITGSLGVDPTYNGNGGGGQTIPESCLWGNASSLEHKYAAVISCGDILSMDASCMRFEGYTYVREIVLWDGVNEATREIVATATSGRAVGQYSTWWTPPVKAPLPTVTYTATAADSGKHVIFRYGHVSGWGETADVTCSITGVSVPSITKQPQDLVRTAGESASFSVTSVACGLSYQWNKNGTTIPGATTDTLTFAATVVADAASYACRVANANGSATSQVAVLTVEPKLVGGASLTLAINFADEAPWNPAPTATAYGVHQSRWQTTPAGNESAAISVMNLLFPFGSGQLDVSYYANNTYSLPGAVDTLPPGNSQVNYGYLDDGGSGYSVTLAGLTTSLGYSKYVVRTIAASDNATGFNTVTITDLTTGPTQDLTYAPAVAGSPSGGKAAVSTTSTALTADSIMITSMRDGTTLTRACLAGFIITDKPVILAQPVGPAGNVFSGAGFSLNADVFGVQTLGYQWRKGGVAIAGATTSAFAKAVAAVADAGVYDLVITNAYGTATSVPVTVSVVSYFPPVVLQQPVARSVFAGRTAQFSVVADGGQLAYQWNKGGAAISGATTTQLVISPVSITDAADYSVTVSNPAGSTNSVNAHLTVASIPATGYLSKVLADGPSTLWRMDESSGSTLIDSWGANFGTYSGSYTLGNAGLLTGVSDTAAKLTPTAKATIPFSTSINNPAGPFSVEFWALPTTAGQECIISSQKRTSGRAGFTIFMNNGGSGFSALLGNNAGGTVFVNGATAVKAGVKYHVVVTYDNATAKVYVNGALDVSASIPFDASGFEPNPEAPFQIGARNSGDGFPYNGVIDEVAVYNYALSAAQIQGHLLSGVPPQVVMSPVTGILSSYAQNVSAVWMASDSDGSKTRTGVMNFTATNDSQVVATGIPQIDSTSGTICLWVRTTDGTLPGPGTDASMILDRRETGGSGSGTVLVLQNDGTVYFQANPSGANPFGSSSAINDGIWHHIAVTYGQNVGDQVTMYIDGVYNAASSNVKPWWWPAGMNVLLGKSRDAYWKRLDGKLDDVRFYTRILTEAEIGQVMSGTVVDAAALKMRMDFTTGPANGFRLTNTPVPGTIQGSTSVLGTYLDLGASPYFHVPTGGVQFFRARVP